MSAQSMFKHVALQIVMIFLKVVHQQNSSPIFYTRFVLKNEIISSCSIIEKKSDGNVLH